MGTDPEGSEHKGEQRLGLLAGDKVSLVAFGKAWPPFLHLFTTSLPMPFLAPSPCLALCSVLILRESFCSHQANTGTLEKTKELSNQSKSVQWRRGWGMAGSGKGRDEDLALGI